MFVDTYPNKTHGTSFNLFDIVTFPTYCFVCSFSHKQKFVISSSGMDGLSD
jgi:hypothetical protein